MLAVACLHRFRALVGLLAVVVCAGAVVIPAAQGQKGQKGKGDRPSKAAILELMRRDPGGLIGGNTQVASDPGQRLFGVKNRFAMEALRAPLQRPVATPAGVPSAAVHRVNFIIGLARGQRLIGGHGHDQLGAHGHNSTIHAGRGHDLIHGGPGSQSLHGGHGHDLIHGGHGHDRLHGGPGHDRLRGGHGHDRLHGGPGHDRFHGGHGNDQFHGGGGNDRFVDREGATMVDTGSGRNMVQVADGEANERVLCAAGSVNRIRVDRGDRLDPDCLGPLSVVRYGPPPSPAPAARAAQNRTVIGDGTNGNPFTAACDNSVPKVCKASAFPRRTLGAALWANEHVPAYKCPPTHPYLAQDQSAPADTPQRKGLVLGGEGPVGINIQRFSTDGRGIATGTMTGFPNSAATNWTRKKQSYKVALSCTNDIAQAASVSD
jgi:RTX calcium-binding nonapeptide repeat (4 copies)